MMTLKYQLTALFVLSVVLLPQVGLAQSRSASQGVDVNGAQQATCLDSVESLRERVEEIEAFAQALRDCNNSQQVPDGAGGCEHLGYEHEWRPNINAPDSLVLLKNGNEEDTIPVILGRDGTTSCPPGTVQQ